MICRVRRWVFVAAFGAGLGSVAFCGHGVATAAPDARTPSDSAHAVAPRSARSAATPQRAARAMPSVSVSLPAMPVREGRSFAVSRDAVTRAAARYVASGGDPGDSPRFFFRDLAVSSLESLDTATPQSEQVRTQLGNLVVSGYFGGIWLRDNLRDAPTASGSTVPAVSLPDALSVSAIGIGLFDTMVSGLTAVAASPAPWITTAAAHASVPVLLALYGYNRGYLDVLLGNPPPGVPSMRNTLQCNGFLDCNSSVFPLDIATRYDSALTNLTNPDGLGWLEMAAWSTVLEAATGAGRFVWNIIAAAGSFSPASYAALVDLSSAYLMVTKSAVLAAMTASAEGDADTARTALLLEAGLWMWSGAYFAGLASSAPRGTAPAIEVN